MKPSDICRDILGAEKLESIIGELSSPQIKAILKEGGVRAKVPGGYVSRNKKRKVWTTRLLAAVEAENGDLTSELLQQWLLNHRRPLLMAFLDRLEITHRQGETDDSFLTSSPRERVLEASTWLLSTHDPAEVKAYLLYVAHQQHSKVFEDWPELAA